MFAKFIELKECPIQFKNRIPESDKQYAQRLAASISQQVIALYQERQAELSVPQAAVLSRLCEVLADRLVRLKPESENFVVWQGFLSSIDFQLIVQRRDLSELSSAAAERLIEFLSLIPVVKSSQVERVYAGRLISVSYMDFLVKKYEFARSHIQDMLMGRTLPEKYIAQVQSNFQLFQHTLNLPISTVIHLLKKHGENLENLDKYFSSVQAITDRYPELARADIQYFCLQTREPQKNIEASYIKAQGLSQELNMSMSRAFWYVCHYHDPDKIREAYAKKTKTPVN